MRLDPNEEKLLRSVALQNARAILLARERAERESIEAKSQISSILESITDAFFALDKEWRFTYINKKGAEILSPLRVSKDSIIGRSFWEEFPVTSGTEIERNYRRAVSEHVTVEFETYFKPLQEWFEVRAYPSSGGLSVYFRVITQRRKSEEALRASEQRLRATFHQAAVGMAVASLDGRFEQVNSKFNDILGYASDELIGRKIVEVTHPEDRKKTADHIARLLSGTVDNYSYEKRFVRKDNKIVWTLTAVTALKNSQGVPEKFIGVVEDITQRKEADEIRGRLAAVVESSDDAIISMGLDTTILTWNKGAERMFGYTSAEVIGKSITMLIPAGHDDEEPMILQRLLEGERVEHYETIRARKDGTLLDVSLTVSPLYDSDAKIIGVSKISRNITDRKRAEEALMQTNESLKEETRILELLNTTGRSIASLLDLQTLVQAVTDSGKELTGAKFGAFFYNITDEQGESLRLYTLSGAPPEAFEKFGHPRATPLFGPTFRGEGPVRCDDVTKDPRFGQWGPHYGMPKGHLPVKSFLAVSVKSRTGEVIGGLFFAHSEPGIFTERSERLIVGVAAQASIAIDNARLYNAAQKEIAERKRVEDALREAQNELSRHADKLEKEVQERTSKLRETVEELEAFSYSVSHDMRSPLRAMQGYSDALLTDYKGKLDAVGEDYLQRIRRASLRMDLLIQDILAYSRVAKGEIQLKSVDVENVIKDVVQSYPLLQPERATITIASEIPPVHGHEAYLTQIVSNLLTNGVKFIEPGKKPVITIRGCEEGEMVRISFLDNGIGIAPEHQGQIFQIFGRVYSEKKFEGTGIGLAIAKKAAERMGGSIGVKSQLGAGSEFYVLLKRGL